MSVVKSSVGGDDVDDGGEGVVAAVAVAVAVAVGVAVAVAVGVVVGVVVVAGGGEGVVAVAVADNVGVVVNCSTSLVVGVLLLIVLIWSSTLTDATGTASDLLLSSGEVLSTWATLVGVGNAWGWGTAGALDITTAA